MPAINLQAKTGNQILVTLDGFTIGAIKSVNMNDDYSPEPVTGIGDIHVAEWVPTVARHTVTVNNMILLAANLRAAGVYTLNGLDALAGRVFDILVVSKLTGEIIRTYMGCSYASGSVEVTANAILISNGSFNALDVVGEGG
jgi:hypothetical protein